MKKHLIIFFLLLLYVGNAIAQKPKPVYLFSYFKNNGENGLHLAYSNDGLNWKALKSDSSFLKPTVSNDKLMRDPCVIRGADGKFHMVWTVSWNDKGIGYASSTDMIHWSEQQFLPVMKDEEGARNCWAPEITYAPKTKTYLIYWATTITGKFNETLVALESKYNHRLYATSTKDFKTYTPTKLFYEPGFNVIDASIVADGKRWVMFLKDETPEPAQKNIRVAFADKLAGPFGQPSPPITGKYWAEGPTSLKMNGKWTVYFDKYTEHKYGAVQSSDLKNWEDISDKISMPPGIRHGTIVEITEKELQKLLAVKP